MDSLPVDVLKVAAEHFAKLSTDGLVSVRTTHNPAGYHATYAFPNGYEVSVICHAYSYGGKSGLLEAWDCENNTDPVGWLDADGVNEYVAKVAARPKKEEPS